jgi:hydrogenase maturation protease
MKIVIIGIGQTMRGDDGVGVFAVQAWQKQHPHTAALPEVCVEIAELPGLDLLELLSEADCALIVDAIKGDGIPGEIHILDEQALAAFDPGSGSAHGWGVAETIRLGQKLGRAEIPGDIKILGITAQQFGIGRSLSSMISEQLPNIIEEIENQVQSVFQEKGCNLNPISINSH